MSFCVKKIYLKILILTVKINVFPILNRVFVIKINYKIGQWILFVNGITNKFNNNSRFSLSQSVSE